MKRTHRDLPSYHTERPHIPMRKKSFPVWKLVITAIILAVIYTLFK